jgi:energy-coupling factor transporter ATP-binding protein EcfA2
VVLVGPNGSGKSTVLEGILIGASPTTADAIVEVIRRHEGGGSGPRWLLWKTGEGDFTQIRVTSDAGIDRRCQLRLNRARPEDDTLIEFRVDHDNTRVADGYVRGVKNKFHSYQPGPFAPLPDVPEVHLVEAYPTSFQRPLSDLYTKAVIGGRRTEALGIISAVLPTVHNVEILTECGEPILHLVFARHSVPASLAGDGIHSLLRLILELAAGGGGVALLEEPEVHQHPGAIRRSAQTVLAAVRRQVQVILTTHSLELIDAILGESSDEDLDRLSLYRLQLQEGHLKSSRLPGREIAFARTTIEDDLR